MLATERLLEIESEFGRKVDRIVCLELDDEFIRLILFFNDGANLRISEQWDGQALKRYSYYWLDRNNELKIGWDNAPHHTKLESFPHHKHVGTQKDLRISTETDLKSVMRIILEHERPMND